jgi:hypothetical protein
MVRQLAAAALGGALTAVGAAEAKPRRNADRKAPNRPAAGDAKDHKPNNRAAPPADHKTRRRKKKHRCPAGQTRCQIGAARHGKPRKACVDLQTDAKHCGQCGIVCGSGQSCVAGACTGTCASDCTGKQCGDDGCGGICGTCPVGQTCQQGHCVCVPDCAGKQCGGDGCGGSCGSCGNGKHCQQGRCVTNSCAGGCGSHGSCQGGACVCDAGYASCAAGSPCDVDIATDPTNCGSCGNVCPGNGQNGQATCRNGACGLTCDAGYFDCGGACIDVANDPSNCGTCGNVCPGGQTCSNSACVCAPDCTGKCDGASDGCGGTCDDSCPPCPPYQIRSAGACVFPCTIAGTCASCTSGFVQCVGNADGTHVCATNLSFSSTPNCPVNGCPDGFTCYSGGANSYTCFEILSSQNC